ncbi:MAG: putative toxin-antitoxin system toxin component, PIN family [Deltaproteobacteria bacterium RBG_16_49_23]|nr:MAG: putative toxin-antitoxin system toxin component, PIN family [Deltaproteobacteria bacterium RBG_16_49_23]
MAKVVIDANVIISAAFGGNPLRAVIRAMEEDEVYLSQTIERELKEVFSKLSKKLTREQITFLNERMRELIGMAKQVSVSTRVVLSRDAKDDHYLSLCKEVEADSLVTGDKDLLSIRPEALKENGISCRILTPQEFVEGV